MTYNPRIENLENNVVSISASYLSVPSAQFTDSASVTNFFTQLSGTTAEFTEITASKILIHGDLRVLGTASVTQLNTLNQTSLVVGDKYITILSGGVDHTGIDGAGVLWGTSSGPGESTGSLGEHAHILYDAGRDALQVFPGLYVSGSTTTFNISGTTAQFTTVTGSTVTGTLAQFTTVTGSTVTGTLAQFTNLTANTLNVNSISSSVATFSGNILIYGTAVLDQNPSAAYLLYSASLDKIVAYPGLYVSGSTSLRNIDVSGAFSNNIVTMAALNIDCSLGNYFTKTISGNSIFTVSNVPASRNYAFVLELEHTSGAITWFSGVEWPNGSAPSLTTGKTHLFIFQTDNGGSRWRASSLINYVT